MKKIFIATLLLFFAFSYAIAQADTTRIISGRVTDKTSGEPLRGASIMIKNNNIQTHTAANGSFNLRVSRAIVTVIISFAEYGTKEVLFEPGVTGIVIELQKKTTDIGEVTVYSGYNTTTPLKATGAYTVIDNKLFNEQAGTSVIERLKYIASGVTEFPQRINSLARGQLLIRGLSTFTSRIQKPLIILDNFEYQGDLNNINPSDVENISILKDAAASAIWGARAANGVIVITTKKANYDQPLQISLSSNWSFKPKPDLFKVNTMGTPAFMDFETNMFNRGFYDIYFDYQNYYSISPLVQLLDKLRKGQVTQAEADQQMAALRKIDTRNEFEKYFYRKGIERQQSLSLQGGTGNHAWNLSLGYDENADNNNATYRRFTVGISNKIRLTPRLEMEANVLFTDSRSRKGNLGFGDIATSAGNLPSYTRFADDNGNPLPIDYKFGKAYLDTIGQGLLMDWNYYPLNERSLTRYTSSIQDINATLGLNYRIIKGLKATVLYRFERQFTITEQLQNKESFYARDLVNNFTQIDYTNRSVKHIVPVGDIQDLWNDQIIAQNLRGQFDYTLKRGEHALTLLAGGELSETIDKGNGNRTYGYDPDRLVFANIDYVNQYKVRDGSYTFIPNPTSFTHTNKRFVSLYTNAAYTFRNKYTISGSARRDASNLFGVNTNDKWKPLWSAGASWDIAREDFYNLSWLPGLRLRASYGHQGNLDANMVALTTFEFITTNIFTQTPYGRVKNYPNDNLKWEQSAMLNLGIDLTALKGRVSASIDHYHKALSDLYAETKVDVTAGIGPNIVKNVGEMKTKGWDIKMNTINTQGIVGWQTELLFNTASNKITKFRELPARPSDLVSSGFLGIQGYDPYVMFTYRWAGLDPTNGNPQGYLDGQVSSDYFSILYGGSKMSDIVNSGSRLPKYSGSVGNTITWKNLSLATRISYKMGYVFLRSSINYNQLVNYRIGHSDYLLRWQQPGDEATTSVPSFSYPTNFRRDQFYNNSEVLVEKGDHIRFEYINLGYFIARKKQSRLPFKSVELHAIANNIGILWRANKKGIDPDFSDNAIPRPCEYSFKLTANF